LADKKVQALVLISKESLAVVKRALETTQQDIKYIEVKDLRKTDQVWVEYSKYPEESHFEFICK
jgi:hypothetical protein